MKTIWVILMGLLAINARAQQDVDTTSLQYALRKGKADMNFRLYYMTTQNQKELSDYYAWAIGGGLKYETGRYKGFQIGVGGYFIWNIGSSDLGRPDPESGSMNRYEIGQFDMQDPYNKNDMARLEDLYLKYSVRASHISMGKMVINTPFINPQDGRMRPSAEQGVWLEVNEVKYLKLQAGWLTKMSPRGTVKWFDVDGSIGIYSQGLTVDGVKSQYKGNLHSAGVGLLGLTYKTKKGMSIQAWETFIANIMNSLLLQADGEWKIGGDNRLVAGLQYTRQDAVNDGGNADPAKTYFDPRQHSQAISTRLGVGNRNTTLQFNYTRITAEGRYLSPREWGREPLYTFIRRERNEGLGDVHAFTANLLNSWNKGRLRTEISYGYYDLPDPTNARLNKYGMPSYHQVLGDVTYDLPGFLKGLRLELLYTYKANASGTENPKAIINKVNMHHLNFIVNYRL